MLARWGLVLLAVAACRGKPGLKLTDLPPSSTQPPDHTDTASDDGKVTVDPEKALRLGEQAKVDHDEIVNQRKRQATQAALQKRLNMIEQEKLNPKSHPLNEVIHADDLTLQMKPLDAHRLNSEEHLNSHHQAVLRMGKAGGMKGAELEALQAELLKHMKDYQAAKARELQYRQKRPSLPKDRQLITEHSILESARALHHRFYRIKMKVILAAKSDAPFERMREMLQSDKFTDEDRKNFENEIAEHIRDKELFVKAQSKRNSAYNHPNNQKIPVADRESKRRKMRTAVIRRQKQFHTAFNNLFERISKVHGEEL